MTSGSCRFVIACAAVLAATIGLHQPMVGLLLVASAIVAQVMSRRMGLFPWLALAVKIALLVGVTALAPTLFGDGLLPGAPDQYKYIDAASRTAEALEVGPFSVDYAVTVHMDNPFYGGLLGWMSFLNGTGSLFLFRLLNVFLSMLLAALGHALARTLYPGLSKLSYGVALVLAFLPSVNVYSMFVLRDVLMAAVVMLVALGLVRRRYELALFGLALMYYTRLQLCFLLLSAGALFIGFGIVRRLSRLKDPARWILAVGFLLGGYSVAPRFVALCYGGMTRWNPLAFLRFLTRFVPWLLGLGFLFAGDEALVLSRFTLGAVRLLMPDTFLVPALFLAAVLGYRRAGDRQREFYVWVLALTAVYAAGYWVTYGGVYVRLLLPLYPLLLVAAAMLFTGRWIRKDSVDDVDDVLTTGPLSENLALGEARFWFCNDERASQRGGTNWRNSIGGSLWNTRQQTTGL